MLGRSSQSLVVPPITEDVVFVNQTNGIASVKARLAEIDREVDSLCHHNVANPANEWTAAPITHLGFDGSALNIREFHSIIRTVTVTIISCGGSSCASIARAMNPSIWSPSSS